MLYYLCLCFLGASGLSLLLLVGYVFGSALRSAWHDDDEGAKYALTVAGGFIAAVLLALSADYVVNHEPPWQQQSQIQLEK